jgi:hypothetical protein
MDIFGMLIWAVVLVSLIVFIVLLVKSFQSWGVVHTLLLSILFIECWTFIFFAGSVSQQRLAFTKAHDLLMSKVDKLTNSVALEMYGDRLDPSINLEKFVPLSNEVNRIAVERGRVWRGAVVQPTVGGLMALQLPANVSNLPVAAPPEAAAGGAAPLALPVVESGLVVDSVIYVFGESRQTVGLVPNVYLGEFVVATNKDGLISLRPTAQDAITRGDFETAAVYEIIPIDSHTTFAAEGSKADVDSIFGRMDKAQISELLRIDAALADAEPGTLDNKTSRKARIIQSYLNDGGRAPDQTPAEALAFQVTFLKDHTEVVDSTEKRNAMEGGYFDLSGRSVDARLKLDSENGVLFKTGDTFVFDESTAKDLEKQGIVSLGERIFVRTLNDYEFGFREARRLKIRAQQDLLLIERELKEVIRTNDVALKQELIREEEGTRLKLDKLQYTKELEVITSVGDSLAEQIEEKKAELSQLYRTLLSLHDQLLKRNQELNPIGTTVPVLNP